MRAGLLFLLSLSGLFAGTLAGCSSFADDPIGTLTRTGHDARVFDPRTGHYEWPDDPPHQHPQPAAPTDSANQ